MAVSTYCYQTGSHLNAHVIAGNQNPAGPCEWDADGLHTSVASVEGCAGEPLAALQVALFVCLVRTPQASDITFDVV